MSLPLVINGVTFEYPQVDDTDWGPDATDWASAVTVGMLQKAGGLFQLLAEVDFGTAFGVKSLYLKSRTTNPADAGQVRLARADVINWRNQANGANLSLGVSSSNVLQFNGVDIQGSISVSDTATIDLTFVANALSADIKSDSITNTLINSAAAIAYSKLNLSASIVNADINASAAIAYSKLNLTGNIVNADINASAAIAYSKLNLTGSIVNADINASAAIAFSKFAALTSTNILVGSAGNVATSVAVTGDVTIGNTGVTAIGANKVVNSMLAQMAQSTIKGRAASSGTGDPVDLTATQATALLNAMVGDSGSGGTKGLVPAPASGDAAAGKFLKADGTWVAPSGAGDVVGPASSTNNGFAKFDGTTGKLLKNSAATIAISDGGTGQVTKAAAFDALSPMTTGGDVIYGGASGTGTALANGTTGQALTSSGGTSAPYWYSSVQGSDLKNLGLAASVGSSALTIALKQADGSTNAGSGAAQVFAGLRSSTAGNGNINQRSVSGALSLTINSLTTLGMVAAQNNNVWFYLLDSDGAGTMKLAAATVRYDESGLITTVAESFTGTVTIASPGVWTATGHGLQNNACITLSTTGALPTGLTAGTKYFIVSRAANTFQLATSPAGTAIITTGSQSGVHTVRVACGAMVSDAVYTNAPFRLIGKGVFNLVTPGTWLVPTTLTAGSGGILPQETIAAKLNATAGGSYTSTNTTIVPYNAVSFDTHGIGFAAVGSNFVAPIAGTYLVQASISLAGGTPALNASATVAVNVNGSAPTGSTGSFICQAAAAYSLVPAVNTIVQLAQWDRVDVRFTATAAGTLTFGTGTGGNYISISKLPSSGV